jgi:fructosamine-3-kinase
MESNISTIIDNIVRENKIFRFASELQSTENEERKEMLREILKKLHNDTNDKSEKAREEISKICVKINENQMKKKWFRLSIEQKIEQITKYIDEKYVNNAEIKTKEKELKKILDMLNEDKLENKHVEYDEKNGKIVNIDYEKKLKAKLKKKSNKDKKSESSSSDSE